MGLLERAIRNGISRGVGDAIGKAVQQAVQPKVNEYADMVADQIDQAANSTAQQAQTAQAASAGAAGQSADGLGDAFANLQQSLENYANEVGKNMKICPNCQTPASADKKFCPSCGTKLPEETLGQGAVCPNCGKQNKIGTRFCQECGTKLPAAVAEEKAAAERDVSALAQWEEKLPQYPVWDCGGTELRLMQEDDYCTFEVRLENGTAARNAIEQYRETLLRNGFRQAGEYPSREHLYKKIDGNCYHVDTEHCLDGDDDMLSIYFNIKEPTGGFDYVKPQPQQKSGFGFKDLFKL